MFNWFILAPSVMLLVAAFVLFFHDPFPRRSSNRCIACPHCPPERVAGGFASRPADLVSSNRVAAWCRRCGSFYLRGQWTAPDLPSGEPYRASAQYKVNSTP